MLTKAFDDGADKTCQSVQSDSKKKKKMLGHLSCPCIKTSFVLRATWLVTSTFNIQMNSAQKKKIMLEVILQ